MFGFPASTEFGKRIPKQKFYENIDITPDQKRLFIKQIHNICWQCKLAATTLNLAAGSTVTEVEVFVLELNAPELDETLLRLIDKAIPYHILYILTYDSRAQAWIGYKDTSGGSAAIRYYHTEWVSEDALAFSIDGLNLDAVYESLVRQVAGYALSGYSGESLRESVERDERRRALEKQIAALERKMRREKQLNRQMEMNAELKKLRVELKQMT